MNQDVKLLLEQLASKLNTTTEFLFEKLAKNEKLNAIAGVIQCSVLILCIPVLYWLIKLEIKYGIIMNANYTYNSNELSLFQVLMTVINAIFFISYVFFASRFIFYQIDEIIKCWNNPEGMAIERILKLLK